MDPFRRLTIKRLRNLDNAQKQIAFAYLACNRMLPNYQYFSRQVGWGNEYCLIEALNVIQQFILGHDIDDARKKQLIPIITQNIPDSHNFSTNFSTYAQNAASAICYTFENVFKLDIEELSWSLTLSVDTVDAFVQTEENFVHDEDLEKRILNHSMMQREMQNQESDFTYLLRQEQLTESDLLFKINLNESKSNIDITKYGAGSF